MPSEPEKKIEPLLGAYAARRREAAGPGGPMPPAVRQALQDEVRRHWPTGVHKSKPTRNTRPWFEVLASLWPRLAVAGGLAVVLAVTLWWLLPTGQQGQQGIHLASAPASHERRVADSVRPLAESARLSDQPAGSPRAPATEPSRPGSPSVASGGDFSQASPADPSANSKSARYAAAPAPPASAPLEPPAPKPQALPSPVPRATRNRADPSATASRSTPATLPLEVAAADTKTKADAVTTAATTPTRRSALPPAPLAPPPAASALDVSAGSGGLQATTPVQSFRNVQAPMLTATGGAASSAASEARQRRGFLVKASPPKGSPVLANFTVEQSGSRVRLIDADGSVYEGEIGSIPTPEGPPAATLLARSTNAAPNMVAFAAMGTNATLRQPVRLTGQLYLESGLELGGQVMPTGFAGQNELQSRRLSLQDQAGRERNSPQVRGGQGPAQANRGQQTSSGQAQILRITGQARFGRTNAIAIDAIPNPR